VHSADASTDTSWACRSKPALSRSFVRFLLKNGRSDIRLIRMSMEWEIPVRVIWSLAYSVLRLLGALVRAGSFTPAAVAATTILAGANAAYIAHAAASAAASAAAADAVDAADAAAARPASQTTIDVPTYLLAACALLCEHKRSIAAPLHVSICPYPW
jgi:hypothetical protein